jgi:hypothetical protein
MADVTLTLWAIAMVALIFSGFLSFLWRLRVSQATGRPVSWGFRTEFWMKDRIAGDARALADLLAIRQPREGPGAAYRRWSKITTLIAAAAIVLFFVSIGVVAAGLARM